MTSLNSDLPPSSDFASRNFLESESIRLNRRIGWILAILIVASGLGWNLGRKANQPLTLDAIDEGAWIYSTYYWYILAHDHDLSS